MQSVPADGELACSGARAVGIVTDCFVTVHE